MNYKFCPECGQKLPINAVFCTNCGAKQPPVDSQTTETSNQTVSSQAVPHEAPIDEPKAPVSAAASSNSQTTAPKNASNNVSDDPRETTETRETQRLQHQQQTQFFDADSSQHKNTQEQADQQAQDTSQQFFNPHEQNEYQEYRDNRNTSNGYYQQAPASAYNESAQPGLSASFEVWLKCFGKPEKCMGRADFWWGYLAFELIYLVATFCLGFLIGLFPASEEIFAIIFVIIYLIYALYSIFATVQRLHDVGHSGWNYLWNLTGIGVFYVLYLVVQPTNWNEQRWVRA